MISLNKKIQVMEISEFPGFANLCAPESKNPMPPRQSRGHLYFHGRGEERCRVNAMGGPLRIFFREAGKNTEAAISILDTGYLNFRYRKRSEDRMVIFSIRLPWRTRIGTSTPAPPRAHTLR